MDDDLTPSESAILFVLMAEAREISNAELKTLYGIDFRKSYRDKLNDLKYVTSQKVGRTFTHQLDDKGWVRVERDLNFVNPKARALGAALTALQTTLRDRVLSRSGCRSFTELFALTDLRAPVPHATPAPDQEDLLLIRLRNAYAALASEPGGWVSITRIRPFFAELPTAEVDEALRRLNRESDVNIVPESNQKMLTAADVEAALHVGGQDKHLLAIGV